MRDCTDQDFRETTRLLFESFIAVLLPVKSISCACTLHHWLVCHTNVHIGLLPPATEIVLTKKIKNKANQISLLTMLCITCILNSNFYDHIAYRHKGQPGGLFIMRRAHRNGSYARICFHQILGYSVSIRVRFVDPITGLHEQKISFPGWQFRSPCDEIPKSSSRLWWWRSNDIQIMYGRSGKIRFVA